MTNLGISHAPFLLAPPDEGDQAGRRFVVNVGSSLVYAVLNIGIISWYTPSW